ncbi:MAG: glutamyl-tRNA reductase [Pseudomonadota bacterium]
MTFLVIGLNHKTAPVQIREKLAFAPDTIQEALQSLISMESVYEAAILSTCNRTELYCELGDKSEIIIINWLQQHHALEDVDLQKYLYVHKHKDAVCHMLRVASGLDSMVLGEPQILGQMKTAFAHAKEAKSINHLMHKLFQHTFSCAKQVRTDTAIGASPVSIAFASVSLAKQIFSDFSSHTALLIGAGETIELVALHLKEVGIKRIIIANRTVEKAHDIAKDINGYAISLSEIPQHLSEADIVISSTASPLPILGKGAVEQAIRIRKHRPIFMVDIAVPRDIEEQVGELEDIYLYTVDDLQDIINEGLKSRQEAALMAEDIIETQVLHFMSWLKSLSAVNTLCHFREQAEQIRDNCINNAKKQLNNGKDPAQIIQEMAKQLTNKILHNPSIQIKQAGIDEREDIIKAACLLFNINPENRQ